MSSASVATMADVRSKGFVLMTLSLFLTLWYSATRSRNFSKSVMTESLGQWRVAWASKRDVLTLRSWRMTDGP